MNLNEVLLQGIVREEITTLFWLDSHGNIYSIWKKNEKSCFKQTLQLLEFYLDFKIRSLCFSCLAFKKEVALIRVAAVYQQ